MLPESTDFSGLLGHCNLNTCSPSSPITYKPGEHAGGRQSLLYVIMIPLNLVHFLWVTRSMTSWLAVIISVHNEFEAINNMPVAGRSRGAEHRRIQRGQKTGPVQEGDGRNNESNYSGLIACPFFQYY